MPLINATLAKRYQILVTLNLQKMAKMLRQPRYDPRHFDQLRDKTTFMQQAIAEFKQYDANREISDEEGERMYMMAEAENRELTEDEHLIYNI